MAQTGRNNGDGSRARLTRETCTGVMRLLSATGQAVLLEVPLANGRRADVMAVTARGEITIVEVKSSAEDFRADGKWPDYLPFCDRFYFAVPAHLPHDLTPVDEGLIVADRWGGEIIREAVCRTLPAARRKALLIQFAHVSAMRLQRLQDNLLAQKRERGELLDDRDWSPDP